MTLHNLRYELVDGYIDHWLVAGPHYRPLPTTSTTGEDGTPPKRPIHLAPFEVDGAELQWQLATAGEEHLLDLSVIVHERTEVRTWAYAALVCPEAQTVSASLTSPGPVKVWCNGEVCHQASAATETLPARTAFTLDLQAGTNGLVVLLAPVGDGPTPIMLGLQLPNAAGLKLQLPTTVEMTDEIQAYETLFEMLSPAQDAYFADDNITVQWPADLKERCAAVGIPGGLRILCRLQNPEGKIFAETVGEPHPGAVTKTVPAHQLVTGPHQLALMPPPELFAKRKLRVRRIFEIDAFSDTIAARDPRTYVERLFQGVRLAMRREHGGAPDGTLLAEWAAMTLDAWSFVHPDRLFAAINRLSPATVQLDRALLALLGIVAHFHGHARYPVGLTGAIDETLGRLAGAGSHNGTSADAAQAEVRALTRDAVLLLTGQRMPEVNLTAAGQAGSAVRKAAEARLTDWLFEKGRYGLATPASDGDALDTLVCALSQLADRAEGPLVRELSAILLDKVLYLVAINSTYGVGTGGAGGTTASLGRLVWGSGIFNTHLWGVVGLANARAYPIPPVIADIARGLTDRDRPPATSTEAHRDPDGAWSVKRTTYRTPDTTLTSFQETGGLRLPRSWQATLGSKVTVWTSQPPHYGDARRAGSGFWEGDRSAPHIDQWEDALIVHYRATDHTGPNISHAHFPVHAFSATAFRENWAFGQKGNAYIALTATTPVQLAADGPAAGRELRTVAEAVWLCQVGRAGDDGTFQDFQEKVLASKFSTADGIVSWQTPRGTMLRSGWEQPLQVDGKPQPTDDVQHLVTPTCIVAFPATQMDILWDDNLLRLDFSA